MYRSGTAFEAQRYAQEGNLLLAGVQIASCSALHGPYDGDLLSRAIAEALLGALAMGEVDTHFPPSHAPHHGPASLQILREVAAMVRAKDARIVNVDATIFGPKPKLTPAVDRMRSHLEDAMGLPADRISVRVSALERAAGVLNEDVVAVLVVAAVSTQPLPTP